MPEIPTSGGSYVVKDGKLKQVEATRPAPPVQVHEEDKAPPAPAVDTGKAKES